MSTAEKIRLLQTDKADIQRRIDELTRRGELLSDRDRARLQALEELRESKDRDIQTLLNL